MVARPACTATLAARTRATDDCLPRRALPWQSPRFKRRRTLHCSESDRPPAGRRRTDSPACLERSDGQHNACAEPLSRTTHAAEDQRIQVLGDEVTVSGPPTDGQPGQERLEKPLLATRSENANSRAQGRRTAAGLDHGDTSTTCPTNWGLTLEMSGGIKRAQHALERPLDRRVRPRRGRGGSHAPL